MRNRINCDVADGIRLPEEKNYLFTKKGDVIMAATKKPVTEKKTTAAVKVEAPKAETKKATKAVAVEEVKKEEPAKKAPAKKAATAKKATAKKAEVKSALHIQFAGKSYTQEDLMKIAKDVWKYDLKQKVGDLANVELYVKPEESKVYYVMNDITGSFDI